MPIVAFPDSYVLLLEGKEVLDFIESLTTNHVSELEVGESIRTIFIKSNAQIIDVVALHHLANMVVMVGCADNLENLIAHISPRILAQDVRIRDVSDLNQVHIGFGDFEVPENTTLIDCSTFQLLVNSTSIEVKATADSWDEYRIKNSIPWFGCEITSRIHPLACGLGELVHENKGCYVGQEVIARMRSRGRQGKELIRLPNHEIGENEPLTKGLTHSLVIRRIQ